MLSSSGLQTSSSTWLLFRNVPGESNCQPQKSAARNSHDYSYLSLFFFFGFVLEREVKCIRSQRSCSVTRYRRECGEGQEGKRGGWNPLSTVCFKLALARCSVLEIEIITSIYRWGNRSSERPSYLMWSHSQWVKKLGCWNNRNKWKHQEGSNLASGGYGVQLLNWQMACGSHISHHGQHPAQPSLKLSTECFQFKHKNTHLSKSAFS